MKNRPYMDIEDFGLREGVTVGVKTVGGKLLYGTIAKFDHNRETNEVNITIDPASVQEKPHSCNTPTGPTCWCEHG